MGWPLLLIGYVAIITTPVLSYEVMPQDSDYSNSPQNWNQPSPFSDIENNWPSNDIAREVTKRALSVLSRWRPLTNVLQRSPFPSRIDGPPRRFSNRSPSMLRPIGQPLRWG